VVIGDYRYRFAQLRASWRPARGGLRRSRATSVVLADVIVACQLIAGLLLIGLAFIGAAGMMKSRAPQFETSRAVLEYAAVFFPLFRCGDLQEWGGWTSAGERSGTAGAGLDPAVLGWKLAAPSVSWSCLRSPPCLLRWSSTQWRWRPPRSTSGPGCESGHHEALSDMELRAANGVAAVPRKARTYDLRDHNLNRLLVRW
jgi:hypothetical protein